MIARRVPLLLLRLAALVLLTALAVAPASARRWNANCSGSDFAGPRRDPAAGNIANGIGSATYPGFGAGRTESNAWGYYCNVSPLGCRRRHLMLAPDAEAGRAREAAAA